MAVTDLSPANDLESQIVGTVPAALPLRGHGVVVCGTVRTAVPVPTSTRILYVKALATNTGKIYFGGPTVTNTVGSTNATTGYELRPGDPMPLVPTTDASSFFVIGTQAGDGVTYLGF